jgi:hypothetical protein
VASKAFVYEGCARQAGENVRTGRRRLAGKQPGRWAIGDDGQVFLKVEVEQDRDILQQKVLGRLAILGLLARYADHDPFLEPPDVMQLQTKQVDVAEG